MKGATAWEERVEDDAHEISKYLLEAYRAGRRDPLSIARLASELDLSRERVAAALGVLVFSSRTVRPVGEKADKSRFYPVEET